MKLKCYLFISTAKKFRIATRESGAYPNEIGLNLEVDVPDSFFNRPNPKVSLEIPKDYFINPDCKIIASLAAPNIAAALKLDIKTVNDGLIQMLKRELDSKKKNQLNRGRKYV